MAILHSEDIIHCDLASRNILVSGNINSGIVCKIADFGMSNSLIVQDLISVTTIKYKESIELKKDVLVPIRWCHPKVIKEGLCNKSTDLWSYGCTLFEIISGGIIPFPEIGNKRVSQILKEYDLNNIIANLNLDVFKKIQENNNLNQLLQQSIFKRSFEGVYHYDFYNVKTLIETGINDNIYNIYDDNYIEENNSLFRSVSSGKGYALPPEEGTISFRSIGSTINYSLPAQEPVKSDTFVRNRRRHNLPVSTVLNFYGVR